MPKQDQPNPKRKAQDHPKKITTKTVVTTTTTSVEPNPKKPKKSTAVKAEQKPDPAATTGKNIQMRKPDAQGTRNAIGPKEAKASSSKALAVGTEKTLAGAKVMSKKLAAKIQPKAGATLFGGSSFFSGYQPPQNPSTSSSASPKKKSQGRFVWMLYHQHDTHWHRPEIQMMGVYTSAQTAIQNARHVMDKETGQMWRTEPEVYETINDFSSNIKAKEGTIFEVVDHEGDSNVVSFKRVLLNENLENKEDEGTPDTEDDDDDGDVFRNPSGFWM
jgi:hypothetical protein